MDSDDFENNMDSVQYLCQMLNDDPLCTYEIIDNIKKNLFGKKEIIIERSINILSMILTKYDSSVLQVIVYKDVKQTLEQLNRNSSTTISKMIVDVLKVFNSIEELTIDSSKLPLEPSTLLSNISLYKPTHTYGHGSASGVGLVSTDIVTNWYNNNFSTISLDNLPVEQFG
ncbi:unnamed protein product [Rotaria sordida]|uniref:Uncharacterized protein n=1 Tax=Rotaria sordida TaxID=392033 RepID=A0A819MJT5_9BILA|nr:unnamed protein product [Rotaria sordida]